VLTRGAAIESLAKVTDVVLDKTGTLTEGKLRIAQVETVGPMSADECLALAQALESGSNHPVARALAEASPANPRLDVRQAVHVAGGGIEARVGGGRLRIGSLRFVQEIAGTLPSLGTRPHHQSQVFLGGDSGWIARLSLEDGLRPDAATLVAGLRAAGLELHLLSGDDATVVGEVSARLGIEKHQGGVSPQEKYDYVKRLQSEGRIVATLGDGLNDAPVLAQADVSIAMGQGARLAQQNADLVLASGKLAGVLDARRIARLAMTAIGQNFFWALAYNAVALPAAAFGLIGPWEAAIGMAASSFVVVLNSSRLIAALR